MRKHLPWRLIALVVILFIAALFAVGQAVTYAWLSAFPEQSPHLHTLEIRFWSYAVAAAVLFVVDVVLLVRLARSLKDAKMSRGHGNS